MLNKNQTKEIFKVGSVLFIITAIAALILAVVNGVTSPIIEQNNKSKLNESMKTILSQATNFELASVDNLSIYYGKDTSGKLVGVCVPVSPSGYGGNIDMVVGVDISKKVTGVDIISQSETAGLGANSTKPEFKDQFIGKKTGISVVKSGAKNNQINAISSSTITSKAVASGVNEALDIASKIIDKEAVK